jgi:ATP-dependent helicase/nuclease subunit B
LPPSPHPGLSTATVEGHHDFGVLEDRLAALIREVKESDPAGAFAPVAIIGPTGRLLGHLRARLAESFSGLLNVHFFHHASLAREAAAFAGAPLPAPLSDRVREAILAGVVAETGGDLARYAAERPGSVAALLATMDDLREAGVPPSAARDTDDHTPRGRECLRLYDAYARWIDSLSVRGLSDRAGVLRAAGPHVAPFIRRFRRVIHYGAYELIGANLDLMRAVESSGVALFFLVPFHPTAPAFEYARRFWSSLGRVPRAIPATGTGRLLDARLPLVYDETATAPPSLEGEGVQLFHAQGAAAELREVALRVLACHRDDGIPLGRIAIVARSLEPYAVLLRPVFQEHGLPFSTTATLGALREARAQAALRLARAVLQDFERQPLMDLFRSGLLTLRRKILLREGHAWDRLGRDWQVSRGYETWTRDLPAWLETWEPYVSPDAGEEDRTRAAAVREARRRQAGSLASAVTFLRRVAVPLVRAASWRAWSSRLQSLCRKHLDGFDDTGEREVDPGVGAVLGVLAEMHDLEKAGVRFAHVRALDHFERSLASATVSIGAVGGEGDGRDTDNGGVRVLDANQSRGLAFDAVFLIGLNAELFPRRPREDPFLEDHERRLLRDRLSLPVPVSSEVPEEERLLLAHLLGSARRRLTVSWQRADETGRAKIPSLGLREIARVSLGAADLDRAVGAARRVPTDPGEAVRDGAARFGLLPPFEARLGAALQLGSPRLLLEAAPAWPAGDQPTDREILAAGLEMLTVIEDFDPVDLRFDAFTGEAAVPGVWSPSRLETLGACPQHYFFRYALGVGELRETLEEYEIDPREMGRRCHAILHDTYRRLLDSGAFTGPEPARAVERALTLASKAWEEHTADMAERLRRYPLLWNAISRLWIEAIERFLRRDVADLARSGSRLLGLEQEARTRIALDTKDRGIEIHGRFDRVLRGGDGSLIVSDYKTGGRPADHVAPAEILRGSRLQMPLYALMAESLAAEWGATATDARAEVLGVGPGFGQDGDEGSEQAVLDRQVLDSIRAGLLETLRVLMDLAAGGSFPLNEESRLCRRCAYVRACRRTHAPTLSRIAAAGVAADFELVRLKNTRARTLAEVRARATAKEME